MLLYIEDQRTAPNDLSFITRIDILTAAFKESQLVYSIKHYWSDAELSIAAESHAQSVPTAGKDICVSQHCARFGAR